MNENILFSVPQLRINLKTIDIQPQKVYLKIHNHNEIELIRVESGTILCTVDEKKFCLSEGSCLLVNSRVMHCVSFYKQNAVCTYLQIDTSSYTHEFIPEASSCSLMFLNSKSLLHYGVFDIGSEPYAIFDAIKRELSEKQPYYDMYIRSQIFTLISFMHRNHFYPNARELEKQKEIKKILPALKYAEQNFTQKISLERVSSILNIDKYYFCKLFRAATNATFTEYITFLRIYAAETMLINTDKSISEIAFESGFTSIQHFNKQFKGCRACTPMEYRRRSRLSEVF